MGRNVVRGMRGQLGIAGAFVSVFAVGISVPFANAHSIRANRALEHLQPVGRPVASPQVPDAGPHPGSHGSTVVTDAQGVLVAERNAGTLVRADRQGNPVATLSLHEGLGQLATDGSGTVFVADRRAGKVLKIDASQADALTKDGSAAVPEPYGLALSPDGTTLYATSVADHELVALDTKSLKVMWRAPLRAEPRGVAISADGKQAAVSFLSSGAVAVLDLEGASDSRATKKIRWVPLDPRDHVEVDRGVDDWGEESLVAVVAEKRSRFEVPTDAGRRQVRSVFDIGYVGKGLLAAPHQLSTSQMRRVPSFQQQDSYGGGPESVPAIAHRLGIIADAGTDQPRTGTSKIRLHQPRAMAYDAAHDTLYLAGYGDDHIMAVADVSQPSAYSAWVANPKSSEGARACGPDGLAVDGDDLWIHCELSRKLIKLTPSAFDLDDKPWRREGAGVAVGPELAPSLRSDEVEHGAELFRRGGDWRISDAGVMACASCHPEGRADGLSWRLGKSILQTPMLAGRVKETAPYKWGGGDETLHKSFKHTLARLGGSPDSISTSELRSLAAYVRSLPQPQAPTVRDADAVARGKKVFNGAGGCIACHNGERLTDGAQYPFDARGLEQTDTPSLLGLAHTPPYYHDGSAVDLYALLTDKSNVHDMADMSELKREQVEDLITYLESL